MVARDGGGWGDHVDEAAEAYSARPHAAVTVAPEDVETMPAATFRVYQDNATSSSTTRSSRKAANADWKKRAPSELQQMQEEASSHSTDLLAMLQNRNFVETCTSSSKEAAPSPKPN